MHNYMLDFQFFPVLIEDHWPEMFLLFFSFHKYVLLRVSNFSACVVFQHVWSFCFSVSICVWPWIVNILSMRVIRIEQSCDSSILNWQASLAYVLAKISKFCIKNRIVSDCLCFALVYALSIMAQMSRSRNKLKNKTTRKISLMHILWQ